MKKYQLWFDFVDNEEKAENVIKEYNKRATPYQKRAYKGHYMPWVSSDGQEEKIIVWTSI